MRVVHLEHFARVLDRSVRVDDPLLVGDRHAPNGGSTLGRYVPRSWPVTGPIRPTHAARAGAIGAASPTGHRSYPDGRRRRRRARPGFLRHAPARPACNPAIRFRRRPGYPSPSPSTVAGSQYQASASVGRRALPPGKPSRLRLVARLGLDPAASARRAMPPTTRPARRPYWRAARAAHPARACAVVAALRARPSARSECPDGRPRAAATAGGMAVGETSPSLPRR
jgi:hypothetical protein